MPVRKSGNLVHEVDRFLTRMSNNVREAVHEAGVQGENLVKEYISTRGVGGKQGRIETGKMRDSVGHRNTGNRYSAKTAFGWIEQGPEYTPYQERGFRHTSGTSVPGMYALSDAFEKVRADVEAAIRRSVRG